MINLRNSDEKLKNQRLFFDEYVAQFITPYSNPVH